MKITSDNYQAFFLDYHEGRLGEKQREELMEFLRQNPSLHSEFDAFRDIRVTPSSRAFEGKSSLKRPVAGYHNYKTFMVASAEGDLDSSGQAALDRFLDLHPSLAKEVRLYREIKCNPDRSVAYPQKKRLKRGAAIRKKMFLPVAVAASLLLFAGSWFYLSRLNPQEDTAAIKKSMIAPDEKTVTAQPGNHTSAADSEQPVIASPIPLKNKEASAPSYVILVEPIEKLPVAGISLPGEEAAKKIPDPAEMLLPDPSFALEDLFLEEEPGEEAERQTLVQRVAHAGMKGIGKLTGSKIRLGKNQDTAADQPAFALSYKNFEVAVGK